MLETTCPNPLTHALDTGSVSRSHHQTCEDATVISNELATWSRDELVIAMESGTSRLIQNITR